MRKSARLLLRAAVLSGFAVGPLAAQSSLEQVERLTRLGRADEARNALMRWWEDDRGDASRRELQRGFWLRGRLTVDPVQAELDFQRLAVLYPSGQFTPDAILRLAQASWAMGDEAAARGYVATLERDYPRSDARDTADEWLADAGPIPEPGDTPTRVVGGVPSSVVEGAGAVPGDSGEDADDPEQVTDSASATEPDADAPGEADAAAAPVMNYYVQLGAFADEQRALTLFDEVRTEGVDLRVVRVAGSRFTHVRVGRFAERAEAVEVLEELAAQGISAALVRDDRAEELIRN